MEGDTQGIINPDRGRHAIYRKSAMENMVLDNINLALSEVYFGNRHELAEYILHPKFIGEATMYKHADETKKDFSVGISYELLHKTKYDVTDISGIILDGTGIGIIKGTMSVDKEVQNLKFTRRNVTAGGLSKEDDVSYEFTAPLGGVYKGHCHTHKGQGSITLYPNDIMKHMIHHDLNEYYKKFVKSELLKEEHK